MKFKSAIIMMFVLMGGGLFSAPVYATTAKEYYKSAITYGEQRQFTDAIFAFTKAIEMDPNFDKAYNNRGVVYFKQGELTHAIFDFDEAIAINHRYADAYCNLGLAYGKQGGEDLAIANFSNAIEINPSYAKAYINRAIAYFQIKEYDKAWLDVHKAEGLENIPSPDFMNALRKASGRDK